MFFEKNGEEIWETLERRKGRENAVGNPAPLAFKLPTQRGLSSYAMNANIKPGLLSSLAVGFSCCSPFVQRTVIVESTPK